jgi:hypothetical protein
MSTSATICNIALGHIGVTRLISALTQTTTEAVQCNLYFETARDAVLADYTWPFATAYSALGLVAEDPSDDWLYAYRYPSDCIRVRRIVTGMGRADMNPPAFAIGQDAQGRLIYSSHPDATIEYTARVSDPSRFDALFSEALSWRMAAFLAPSLGRVQGAQNTALQMYERTIGKARSTAANEAQQQPQAESEFVRARD